MNGRTAIGRYSREQRGKIDYSWQENQESALRSRWNASEESLTMDVRNEEHVA